ncbi:Hypothetical protein SMAX5B_006979 [Scophthalmus maximus]|uniref:Uncharacterized protein n=1 Tax=Scophthalmus maximus TaxID=52904 RepID=A0A2U9AWI7_SCOMX|nr:Hypothetical protein SMAX5B_006979 [Scophthalmus maximus]
MSTAPEPSTMELCKVLATTNTETHTYHLLRQREEKSIRNHDDSHRAVTPPSIGTGFLREQDTTCFSSNLSNRIL